MVMGTHLILTLLLIERGLTTDGLAVMVNLIGGEDVVGRVGAQFEVMGLQLMQLLVVQFSLFRVIPCPQQCLISRGKGSLLCPTQTAAAEGIRAIGRSRFCLFRVVVFVVDGTIGLGVVAQVEVCGPLVHPPLSVIFIAIKEGNIKENSPSSSTYHQGWLRIVLGQKRWVRSWGFKISVIILRMEALFLCWMLDKRWLFGLPNPCIEYTLIIPALVNLATLVAILIERSSVIIEVDSSIIILLTLYVFLGLLCILLLVRTYRRGQEKMGDVRENVQAIRAFRHGFELKKGVWSWLGLCIVALSAIQLGVNCHYISISSQAYGCLANYTRFYLDVVGWGWIALIVVLFLLCKLIFLFFAWKHPEKYLRFKDVI